MNVCFWYNSTLDGPVRHIILQRYVKAMEYSKKNNHVHTLHPSFHAEQMLQDRLGAGASEYGRKI